MVVICIRTTIRSNSVLTDEKRESKLRPKKYKHSEEEE
jgi:hypothetical protein